MGLALFSFLMALLQKLPKCQFSMTKSSPKPSEQNHFIKCSYSVFMFDCFFRFRIPLVSLNSYYGNVYLGGRMKVIRNGSRTVGLFIPISVESQRDVYGTSVTEQFNYLIHLPFKLLALDDVQMYSWRQFSSPSSSVTLARYTNMCKCQHWFIHNSYKSRKFWNYWGHRTGSFTSLMTKWEFICLRTLGIIWNQMFFSTTFQSVWWVLFARIILYV